MNGCLILGLSNRGSRWSACAFWFVLLMSVATRADDWPQWLGPKRDGEWRESGILRSFPEAGLKAKWTVPLGGGYSGPAVVGDRVYVMDRHLADGVVSPKNPFDRNTIAGSERVLCLDANTGKSIWVHEYPSAYTVSYAAGPRVTPSVQDGKVYTLGAEGNLVCLDARKGTAVWSHDLKQELHIATPTWGFAGHPLVDGKKLICLAGGEGSVVMAFDKDSGKELWRALSAKEPGYAPPMIYTFGGRRQLILWHPESVNGLDPETGKVLWTYSTEPIRFGMTIPTPRQVGDRLFLTSFYNGSLFLDLKDGVSPKKIWQSAKISEKDTDGLHSVMCTPWIENGYIYSACSYGQFRCLNVNTGERLWETFAPTSGKSQRWGHAFVIKNKDRFFLFSETGDLILADLSPQGYREIGRTHLIDAVNPDPGRPVVWSHPAFAHRCIFVRNDREMKCVSLAVKP